jgi:hypothetical protein
VYGDYVNYRSYRADALCYRELHVATYLTGELIPRQFFLMELTDRL